MRAAFIVVGIGLIRRFHWITYIFGALLVYSGIKLFRQHEAGIEPQNNPVLRLFRRWVPTTENYEGDKFVVLGLRSMYFLLAGMMELFHYLHYGLAAILIFVGAKMLVSNYYPIPTLAALGVVAGVLLVAVLASLLHPKSQRQ